MEDYWLGPGGAGGSWGADLGLFEPAAPAKTGCTRPGARTSPPWATIVTITTSPRGGMHARPPRVERSGFDLFKIQSCSRHASQQTQILGPISGSPLTHPTPYPSGAAHQPQRVQPSPTDAAGVLGGIRAAFYGELLRRCLCRVRAVQKWCRSGAVQRYRLTT